MTILNMQNFFDDYKIIPAWAKEVMGLLNGCFYCKSDELKKYNKTCLFHISFIKI